MIKLTFFLCFIYLKVVIGASNGLIAVYNTITLDLAVSPFQAHTAQINLIKQSPYNSSLIVTCSNDGTVKIWNLLNWTLIRNYRGSMWGSVYSFDFIDEDTILSGMGMFINIWSIRTGVTLKKIRSVFYVLSLKILSNGLYFACGEYGYPGINIYNISDLTLVKTFYNATFSKYLVLLDNYLVASSDNNDINIWDYRASALTGNAALIGHTDAVYGLKLVSKDILASASRDTTIKLWNITSNTLIRTLESHNNYIYWSLDLLNDGNQTLVSGSLDNNIKFWHWNTGQLLKTKFTGLGITALTVAN